MSHVCVVGLGKIGLPLAAVIAGSGRLVVGLDTSREVVASVNDGRSPFPGEPGLDERLEDLVSRRALRAMEDPAAAVRDAEVVIIVVPLLVDDAKCPDFSALDAATAAVGPHLAEGVLVSYETTLPVGATRGRFVPALAHLSGLETGSGLFVCHSPERVSSGTVFRDLRQYPKLVGGIDRESDRRAVEFYEGVLDFDDREDLPRRNGVWSLGSAEAAELAKLAETSYRDLNIAFANELAIAAEGIGVDVAAVIEGCNSQPYSHIHHPGVWVGGHCIPVYPHLLMSSIEGLRLAPVARQINDGMAERAVEKIAERLGGLADRRVAVLGLAFRGGVKEDAVSGAYALVDSLESKGATALVHDPLFSRDELVTRGFQVHRLGDSVDAVVLHTDHPEYRELGSQEMGDPEVVYDGRRVLNPERFAAHQLVRIGHGEDRRS